MLDIHGIINEECSLYILTGFYIHFAYHRFCLILRNYTLITFSHWFKWARLLFWFANKTNVLWRYLNSKEMTSQHRFSLCHPFGVWGFFPVFCYNHNIPMGLWHPIDEAERTWCKLNLWLYAGIGNITESLKMPLGQRGSLLYWGYVRSHHWNTIR